MRNRFHGGTLALLATLTAVGCGSSSLDFGAPEAAANDAGPSGPGIGTSFGREPATCHPGQKVCGATCARLDDPSLGCGSAACTPCAVANGSATCAAGACAVARCAPGYERAGESCVASSAHGTWETLAGGPLARGGFGAVVAEGQIHVIGGLDGVIGSPATYTQQAYSPLTKVWEKLPNLLTPRYSIGAAVGADGRIYVIGGMVDMDARPRPGPQSFGEGGLLEAYAPTTRTWTTLARMPTMRRDLVAVAAGDRIYALGGNRVEGDNTILTTVEAYTPRTNTWTSLASMPSPRGFVGATLGPDGRIYVIGGSNAAGIVSTVEAYSPSTNTWTNLPNLPSARSSVMVAAGADGRIYAIGGDNGGGCGTDEGDVAKGCRMVDAYTPSTNTWTTVASLPSGHFGGQAVSMNGRIYVIGGVIGPSVDVFTP